MTSDTAHPLKPGSATPVHVERALMLVTRLAPGVAASAVADIFKTTRERHRGLGITGTMLFDGERFGMLICGSHDAVGQSFAAVCANPKKASPTVLADGTDVPGWAGQSWRSGWCEADALAGLERADAPRGAAALQALHVLVGHSDLL